jgi:hypothetical protein
VLGNGANATSGSVARVRIDSWELDDSAADLKGRRIDVKSARESSIEIASNSSDELLSVVRRMSVGGRTLFLSAAKTVIEVELLSLQARPTQTSKKEDSPLAEATYAANAHLVDEQTRTRASEARKYASENSSEVYRALVKRAQTGRRVDMTAFGIVLGGQWINAQDMNNCSASGWSKRNEIPFCVRSNMDDGAAASERWNACVQVDGQRFDTSWVASAVGVPQSSGNGLMDGLSAIFALIGISDTCQVTVGVLPDGTVGRVAAMVGSSPEAKRILLDQLTTKYGQKSQSRTKEWTSGERTTVRAWLLGDVSIEYDEQVETMAGTAFDGGRVEFVTPAWQQAVAIERKAPKKPAI